MSDAPMTTPATCHDPYCAAQGCQRSPADRDFRCETAVPIPTSKRPRKDEILSAAKALRDIAARERNYAAGQRELAANARTPDIAAHCAKAAGQMERKADRMTRVAEWMTNA